MSKKYNNEEQIKKELQIKTWREMSKDKFIQYLKLAPNIDKEVHLKILEQVPNFVSLTTEITKGVLSVAESNKETTSAMLDILKDVITTFTELSRQENISSEERRFIVESTIRIAEIINQMDERNKGFLKEVLKVLGWIGTFAIAVLAVIFSFKYKGEKSDS